MFPTNLENLPPEVKCSCTACSELRFLRRRSVAAKYLITHPRLILSISSETASASVIANQRLLQVSRRKPNGAHRGPPVTRPGLRALTPQLIVVECRYVATVSPPLKESLCMPRVAFRAVSAFPYYVQPCTVYFCGLTISSTKP
jgi:hypothetical protein